MLGEFKIKTLIFFIVCLFTISSIAGDLYPFDSKTKESQFQVLSQNLRCLVCQNQSLADSQSFLAQDLRKELYQLVSQGQSNDQIMQYFQKRYGDFVLFQPQVNSKTFLLWSAPLLLIFLGVFLFWWCKW